MILTDWSILIQLQRREVLGDLAQHDKRQALLKATLVLFTENGFHGTPTSKIAKEAGVATGALFNYFKTKEELINQLYLEVKQGLKMRLTEGVMEERTVRGKAYRMWYNSIRWALQCPEELSFFSQFSSSPYISNITREEAIQHFQGIFELKELSSIWLRFPCLCFSLHDH
jgi:AcrR family transcriptional regulator